MQEQFAHSQPKRRRDEITAVRNVRSRVEVDPTTNGLIFPEEILERVLFPLCRHRMFITAAIQVRVT